MKIPAWVRNEQKYRKDCRRLRALASRVAQGKETVIEGSRNMLKYRLWMREEQNKDFDIFVVVGTQSDHLPVGSVRQYWAPDALLQKDKEILKLEDLYRVRVIRSATRIYEKYNRYVEEFGQIDRKN
jgi:hypothetical protein